MLEGRMPPDLRWAFNSLGLEKIWAEARPENIAQRNYNEKNRVSRSKELCTARKSSMANESMSFVSAFLKNNFKNQVAKIKIYATGITLLTSVKTYETKSGKIFAASLGYNKSNHPLLIDENQNVRIFYFWFIKMARVCEYA